MSDISLAVGDGTRRMTYAELAAMRGISKHAAETLVRWRKWLKQIGNDGVVRVLVPPDEAPLRRPRRQRVTTNTDCDPPLSVSLIREVVREVVGAYIAPLTGSLNARRFGLSAPNVSLRLSANASKTAASGLTSCSGGLMVSTRISPMPERLR